MKNQNFQTALVVFYDRAIAEEMHLVMSGYNAAQTQTYGTMYEVQDMAESVAIKAGDFRKKDMYELAYTSNTCVSCDDIHDNLIKLLSGTFSRKYMKLYMVAIDPVCNLN